VTFTGASEASISEAASGDCVVTVRENRPIARSVKVAYTVKLRKCLSPFQGVSQNVYKGRWPQLRKRRLKRRAVQ
jgi:hypothetical protein